ncbi:putative peptidoglycan glycosyltransferase FtsW [Streptococcus thermophilus]|uniref:cell division peptidoglycan polymerase FtsW n=1 Tax=Streptococcus thermophilus TaxID=1308 RepID=UPI0015C2A00E|nr:FtsW/RodA/SpoVE family cell cycle protein [Streptococcus thermophilus]CAD0148244.1 putative peptidoglycan glycosyltransferase FtsW [Streptococcus thermophilus]CAD0149453.1 putative peptidoglycan glycosyltransferase FtsW [Streptococcus thermophilus]
MKIEKKHLLDYTILIPYLILSVVGLIVVYSTTSARLVTFGANPFASVMNQGAFWLVSLLFIFFIYRLKLNFLRKDKVLGAVIIVEIILLVVAKFFTKEINGANGWIVLGPLSFQPAEYLKVIVVWYLAHTFSKQQSAIEHYDYQALTKNRWIPRTKEEFNDWRYYLLVMIGLVAIQPDLGNAAIIVLTTVIMFSISGVGYRWFTALFAGIVGLSSAFLGLIALVGVQNMAKVPVFGYVAKRFAAYFNPFKDLTGSGLQLSHSYYAMSNGEWFGLGLGNSIEKTGYLPEATTDFVFSIVIEELGLIGAGLILALLFFLILRIMIVGVKARNPFNSMMALGVGALMLMQVFVNIGGISGLIPSTGVTFPFLSQGGNSLLVTSVGIAFVLNIAANEKRDNIVRTIEEELSRTQELENQNEKIVPLRRSR